MIGTFVKMLESLGSTAAYTAFLCMFFGFMILGDYFIIKEGVRALKVTKKHFFPAWCLEFFSQGIYDLTYNLAIERIDVSYSAILLNISPLFTATLSSLFFKEKIGKQKSIGIGINILGWILSV